MASAHRLRNASAARPRGANSSSGARVAPIRSTSAASGTTVCSISGLSAVNASITSRCMRLRASAIEKNGSRCTPSPATWSM